MSYIKGRQNIYSIITNSFTDELRTQSMKQISNLQDSGGTDSDFTSGMPNSLLSMSFINADCGNPNNNEQCLECLKTHGGYTEADLTGDNYNKNLSKINSLRNNECFGNCSCSITNVNFTNNLIYSIGYNINSDHIDTNKIYENVKNQMESQSSDTKTTKSKNWLPALLGVPGTIFAAAGGSEKITTDISQQIQKVINNISITYSQTINQLLLSSQVLQIKGTGIKVKNISFKNLQNAVLTALESNCQGGSNCVINELNDITNKLIVQLTDGINKNISGMFDFVYQQNAPLIRGTVAFIILISGLYFFMLFKRSARNKTK